MIPQPKDIVGFKIFLTLMFVFFLLSFFSARAMAFQYFNYNPDITDNYNGTTVLDMNSNTSSGWAICWWYFIPYPCLVPTVFPCYNVTYNSTDTDMYITSLPSCDWNLTMYYSLISLRLLNDGSYIHSDDNSEISSYLVAHGNPQQLTLPRNKEGLVVLNYYLNNSNNIYPPYSMLKVVDATGATLNWTYLSSGAPANASLIIPRDINSDRNLTITATWYFGNSSFPSVVGASQWKIERFAFYTFDLDYPNTQPSFLGSLLQTLCNTTSADHSCLGSDKNQNQTYYSQVDYIDNAHDGFGCIGILDNNVLQVSRGVLRNQPSLGGSYQCVYQVCGGTRGAYQDWVCSSSPLWSEVTNKLLFQEVSNYRTLVTHFSANGNDPNVGDCAYGAYYDNWYFEGSISGQRTLHWICDNITSANDLYRHPINLENYGYAGDRYVLPTGSFPNFVPSCSPVTTCVGSLKQTLNGDCTVSSVSCGSYLCNANQTDCNYPPIVQQYGFGSFCLSTLNSSDMQTYVTYNLTGSYYNSCTPLYCYQNTTNTISCLTQGQIYALQHPPPVSTAPLFGSSDVATLTPAGVINSVYVGVMGFVNAMGGSFMVLMFMIVGALIIMIVLVAINQYVKNNFG